MSKIKEILCMHHSHLDIGYTHPQTLLLELQRDYIDQAIDLCLSTSNYPEESKFRWTCEATYPVLKWLQTATDKRKDQFKKLIKDKQISVTVMPMHTTPLCNTAQMDYMLKLSTDLSKCLDIPISTAINHDVNGQPWTISQMLLDSGIDFYITGINIHFGGIPFKRPAVFRWETPDGRELLTFLGEHYSLFSQFLNTSLSDTGLMHKGIKDYVNRLEQGGYNYDFAFLTATNPPLYDNNSPDAGLAELINRYNQEGHEYTVRFVTPEMLREKVLSININDIPVHKGDWTDYWNFGCGSSAKETRVNRRAKETIRKAELLEAFSGSPGEFYDRAKDEAYINTVMYDEHTWGAAQSISDPDDEEVYSQRMHKSQMAYKAADLSAYLLGRQIEQLAENDFQSNEPDGIVVVNTSSMEQEMELKVPEAFLEKGRHLSALRMKRLLPYNSKDEDYKYFGTEKLQPFSWTKIPFSVLEHNKASRPAEDKGYKVTGNSIETPFYRMTFNPATGRIEQLYDLVNAWAMLDKNSQWTLFEYVRETIDPLYNEEHRSTFFPRDVELGNRSVSVWNHNWIARRQSAERILKWHIEEEANSVSFVMEFKAEGVEALKQKITFSTLHPRIKFKAYMKKENFTKPEGIYFAFPLNIKGGWKSRFDTAGAFIELDREQLGKVSRDWVTVDQTVSIYDDEKGVVLACPDAPMVQIGDFNFGRESQSIERKENPLLLAWPMNNYWDTNFWISQPGPIQLSYEMTPFKEFDAINAYNLGQLANEPLIINAAVSCKEVQSGKLFEGNGEGVVPVMIRPAKKEGSFIVMLKNMTKAEGQYSFNLPGKTILKACFVNVLGEEISESHVIDNEVKVNIPPCALSHLLVAFK